MNKKVKQLAKQAYEDVISNTPSMLMTREMFEQKFAELIVRECAQACINEGKTYAVESAGQYQSNLYATAIKKHFGVEE